MKLGKVTGGVKTRSIDNQIRHTKRAVENGAGDFCAVFASCAVYGPRAEALERTFCQALDQASADMLFEMTADMQVWLPVEESEDTLRQLVRGLDVLCAAHDIPIARIQSEVTAVVREPLFQIALRGRRQQGREEELADRDVVVVGYLAAEGSMLLARDKYEELLTRYSARFIEKAQDFGKLLLSVPEAATAISSNICMAQAAGEGGILKALWDLAERAGVGLTIEWKALPVKQETIEICNFLNLNPYDLLSGGVMVCICKDGAQAVQRLEELGIMAALVGRTTTSLDRVLVHEDERRFLEPGKADEIYKTR